MNYPSVTSAGRQRFRSSVGAFPGGTGTDRYTPGWTVNLIEAAPVQEK